MIDIKDDKIIVDDKSISKSILSIFEVVFSNTLIEDGKKADMKADITAAILLQLLKKENITLSKTYGYKTSVRVGEELITFILGIIQLDNGEYFLFTKP